MNRVRKGDGLGIGCRALAAGVIILALVQIGISAARQSAPPATSGIKNILLSAQAAFPCEGEELFPTASESVCLRSEGELYDAMVFLDSQLHPRARAITNWEVIQNYHVKQWQENATVIVGMVGQAPNGGVRIIILRLGREDNKASRGQREV